MANETDEQRPQRRGDIRLRAASGVVIDHSLPLHGAIDDQWRKGELHRVDDDGMPWEGDEYDLSSAYERRARDGRDDLDDAAADSGEVNPDEGDSGEQVDGQVGGEAPAVVPGEPVRPADNAPVKEWRAYAVAISAAEPDDAASMNRNDLIALCTPPELNPLNPQE